MDWQHTFRQAHQDRLEDGHIIQYRPNDGFGVYRAKQDKRRTSVFKTLVNLAQDWSKKAANKGASRRAPTDIFDPA